jgi:hypothetical protein
VYRQHIQVNLALTGCMASYHRTHNWENRFFRRKKAESQAGAVTEYTELPDYYLCPNLMTAKINV